MAPAITGRTRPTKPKKQARSLKRKRDGDDLKTLQEAVTNLDPKNEEIKNFSDLPLSRPTASGLEASHFKTLTDVQSKSIPLALKGLDCLGAAKTGSGKTLAFLVPVLENLYRQQWTEFDGLGALIISPTRELAIQIFEVLRKIGRHHTFSAGLVIGGKSLQEERERLARMNILVCTPGRMLQHMDQTAMFEVENLQMLVLDEADRIMDMGFQKTVDAIVDHLPPHRQTLLFSATQTRKVSDLARLSLKDPEYIAVHEAATSATPSTLQQHYVVVPLPEKLNTLFSFIRSNLKAKILVFLSSGKQVRFVYESFRHLQPGVPLLHLHGRQRQTARLDITTKFAAAKHSCLFSTDVVARGLDFPAVDWVVQVDCPEDADTYIHRVGRTARYERNGRAVLFLEPNEEEGMLQRLEHKKVPIERINIRQKKQQSISSQLQNMCFKEPELKYLGQKAFMSYARSVHHQKDKDIFKINDLPMEEFASSLGLPGAPRIKFLKGDDAKTLKNASRQGLSSDDDSSGEDEEDKEPKEKKQPEKPAVRTKYDRMFERRNQDVLADHYKKMIGSDDESDHNAHDDAEEDDDFLTVKSRYNPAEDDSTKANEPIVDGESSSPKRKVIPVNGKDPMVIDSKRREKLLKSKKKLLKLKGKGTKLVYDENGEAHPVYELENEDQFRQGGAAEDQRTNFLEQERQRVTEADRADKELAKEKRKEKRDKRRARENADAGDESDEVEVELAPFEPAEGDEPVNVQGESDEEENREESSRPKKRSKKWFEDDSGTDTERRPAKHRAQALQGAEDIDNLEDLEALASGLLG
ncbi:MAG: ATP-dependent RNA helicase dbp4 [Chaenotheca gracillima]|nr:MAG: ATP-dependent RNA helicase dbp4 [Chaenotheca gracillima]